MRTRPLVPQMAAGRMRHELPTGRELDGREEKPQAKRERSKRQPLAQSRPALLDPEPPRGQCQCDQQHRMEGVKGALRVAGEELHGDHERPEQGRGQASLPGDPVEEENEQGRPGNDAHHRQVAGPEVSDLGAAEQVGEARGQGRRPGTPIVDEEHIREGAGEEEMERQTESKRFRRTQGDKDQVGGIEDGALQFRHVRHPTQDPGVPERDLSAAHLTEAPGPQRVEHLGRVEEATPGELGLLPGTPPVAKDG